MPLVQDTEEETVEVLLLTCSDLGRFALQVQTNNKRLFRRAAEDIGMTPDDVEQLIALSADADDCIQEEDDDNGNEEEDQEDDEAGDEEDDEEDD